MLEMLELVHLGCSFKHSITEVAAWDQAGAELWQCSMTLEFPGLMSQPGTDPVLEVQKPPPFWLGFQSALNELVTHPGSWVFWIYTVPSTGAEGSIHTLGIHAIKLIIWTQGLIRP